MGWAVSATLGLVLLASSLPAVASDELSIVTYNIRALPPIITRDDSSARVRRIPAIASSYDVVALQEAFEFRRELRALFRGHLPRGVPDGGAAPDKLQASLFGFDLDRRIGFDWRYDSGLATFVAESYGTSGAPILAAFDTCAGWIGGRYDCWAAKGVLCDTIRLPSGVAVDLCNTHLDSGTAEADQRAREAQLDQIAAVIEARSSPNALLIVGDLNLSMTCEGAPNRGGEARLYERLVARLGLSDTGVCGEDHRWENTRDDFILYRSGAEATLRLLDAGEDPRFVHAGEPLSDHPALFARFAVDGPGPARNPGL